MIIATRTDANTAHSGGFINPMTRRKPAERLVVRRLEGISPERILNAGKDVKDSLDAECNGRLSKVSAIGSEVEVVDLVD